MKYIEYKRFQYVVYTSLMLCIMYFGAQHVTFNSSISEIRGYYIILSQKMYKKNDMVLICIKDKTYLDVLRQLKLPFTNNECPSHMDFLLKRIVASAGDSVEINHNGVLINGKLSKNSIPLVSFAGIKLYPKKGGYILKDNQFFVLGLTPHSYDSRYFGVVDKDQIKDKAYLIWSSK